MGGGELDEREIGDELDTDKAGMRNIGGEGLKRRYCRDAIVTYCRKWPLRAITFYQCDILKVQIFQRSLSICRWSLDLKTVAEGCQSFGLRHFENLSLKEFQKYSQSIAHAFLSNVTPRPGVARARLAVIITELFHFVGFFPPTVVK